MKLPNASAARVDYAKVNDYLLSETQPEGQHKARAFSRLGFHVTNPGGFVSELLRVARTAEVVEEFLSIYGKKYVIDGVFRGLRASGTVRTVWLVERATAAPRLVTAYLRAQVSHERT